MKPYREVWLVEWFDAHDLSYDWCHVDDLDSDPKNVQSVGFLVDPSPVEGHLTLACNDDGDGSVANGINIPLVNVVAKMKLG